MFERPRGGERAVLVHLDLPNDSVSEDLEEFERLVVSAGAEPVAIVTGSRTQPDPKYYIGTGKVEEVALQVEAGEAEVVLFNHALSPAQERNLERAFQCRVLDRTGLILDIFAQRARTHEGKLQVELAQLEHLATRLVRGWTHLERQKGGIGLRGPGETQLETDRRLLRDRIRTIHRRLEKVRRQRDQGRRARRRATVPTVSLVGYTNAGKSTLFNSLTGAEVFAADQLFATLDPTLRRIRLAEVGDVVLADTVGFIRHLPHELVAAFRATLEETLEATLLLQVVDAHDPQRDAAIRQVNQVLAEIGADTLPQLEVYNKIDAFDDMHPRLERDDEGRPRRVWISASTGAGLELLRQALSELLAGEVVRGWVDLPPSAGRLRAQLFELGAVLAERDAEGGGWRIEVQLPRRQLDQLVSRDGHEQRLAGLAR